MGGLGTRMKCYEESYKFRLPERLPVIIRLDGKNFHTMTRSFSKPFDERLIDMMVSVAEMLVKEVQGSRFAYTQSDEISLFLFPWTSQSSDSWFSNEIQKIVSLSAGLASAEASLIMGGRLGRRIVFDSRAFVLPMHEVINYFIWRQQDWERNSLNMLASSLFTHGELHNKNATDRHDLLHSRGINWNDLDTHLKRGVAITYLRSICQSEWEMPILSTPEGREWFWRASGIATDRSAIDDQYTSKSRYGK